MNSSIAACPDALSQLYCSQYKAKEVELLNVKAELVAAQRATKAAQAKEASLKEELAVVRNTAGGLPCQNCELGRWLVRRTSPCQHPQGRKLA